MVLSMGLSPIKMQGYALREAIKPGGILFHSKK